MYRLIYAVTYHAGGCIKNREPEILDFVNASGSTLAAVWLVLSLLSVSEISSLDDFSFPPKMREFPVNLTNLLLKLIYLAQ